MTSDIKDIQSVVTLKPEQELAIEHGEGNILISASAGSGKTFVMIERLIRLIKQKKAKINEVLAVTFTESAALDMKEKLKSSIKKQVEKGDKSLAEVVSEVDTADISTLHSFCGQLIRRYFFTCGVAPDFTIADENKSGIIKQESLNKTFKYFYSQKEDWFLSLVDKFSVRRSDTPLKELIMQIFGYFSAEANIIDSASKTIDNYLDGNFDNLLKEYKRYFNKRLTTLSNQLEHALHNLRRLGEKGGVEFCESILQDLYGFIDGDIYAIKQIEKYDKKITFSKKLPQEVKYYKEIAVGVRDNLKKTIIEFSKYLSCEEDDRKSFEFIKEDSKSILKVLFKFLEIYESDKREENLLDFSDLEHFALKVLEDDLVRQTVKEKYKYIFIDEYQDVNAVQEEIINRITNDNLFMVGDVKQSIYGFRGCRADFFSNKLEYMPTLGQKTLQLDYNFRSADAVIKMVNTVFTYCMTKEVSGIDYTKSLLLSGGIYPKDAVGRASLHAIVSQPQKRESEKPRVYDILEEIKNNSVKDATKISSLVTKLINQELQKKFYDTKEKRFRQISFKDICILTRKREDAYVSSLVNGLIRHGVPVISEVKQEILLCPEIQVMTNVLKLIDCFENDICLASTLKSPIGKFSEENLAEIMIFYLDNVKESKGNRKGFYHAYNYYLENANTELCQRLKEFDKYFEDIRFLADFVGAYEILEKIIVDSDFYAHLYAQKLGDSKVKRLRKFISLGIVDGRKLTVYEFLNMIDNNPKAFKFVEVKEDDAVRVMTMHSSKGLEFSVVIICGLDKKMHVESPNNVCCFDREYGFAIKYFDREKRVAKQSILRGLINQKSKEEGLKEELRLFYVALTRATYSLHLIVDGGFDVNSDEFFNATTFKDCLPKSIEVILHDQESLEMVNLKKEVRQVVFGVPDQTATKEIDKNLTFSYPYKEDTILPLKTSVSKEIAQNVEQNSLEHYLFEEHTTNIEKGIIAHKFMENLEFTTNINAQNSAEQMIKEGILTKEQIEKIDLNRLQRIFDSGVFDSIINKQLYREKGFFSKVDAKLIGDYSSSEGVVIQGVIDLLVVDQKGAEIIDYKYSSLVPDSIRQKYSRQLQIYAHAFTNATGIKVNKTTIINLFTGEVINL